MNIINYKFNSVNLQYVFNVMKEFLWISEDFCLLFSDSNIKLLFLRKFNILTSWNRVQVIHV